MQGKAGASYSTAAWLRFSVRYVGSILGVYLLVVGQHLDELAYTGGSGFLFLGGLESVENGVPINAVEGSKEFFGFLVPVQFFLEIIRNGYAALGVVGRLPPAVGLCLIYLTHPGRLHSTLFNEGACPLAINS